MKKYVAYFIVHFTNQLIEFWASLSLNLPQKVITMLPFNDTMEFPTECYNVQHITFSAGVCCPP
jgi:hypothetical protein